MSADYILSWILVGSFIAWIDTGIVFLVIKILDKIEDKKEKDFFKKWEKSYKKYTPNSIDCGTTGLRWMSKRI